MIQGEGSVDPNHGGCEILEVTVAERQVRLKSKRGIRHVFLRGIHRQVIFNDNEDKIFLECLWCPYNDYKALDIAHVWRANNKSASEGYS